MFPTGPNLNKLEFPANCGLDENAQNNLINKEFYVFCMKFSLAVIALVLGIYLIIIGIQSASVIKFSFKEATLEMNNAMPGIVLAFVSLILMLFSRLNIKFK